MSDTKLKATVRRAYGKIALDAAAPCCGVGNGPDEVSARIGYSQDELASLPEGANLGLGCGNPLALASLRTGDVVLDLGSGAGIDCFLAAQHVGKTGRGWPRMDSHPCRRPGDVNPHHLRHQPGLEPGGADHHLGLDGARGRASAAPWPGACSCRGPHYEAGCMGTPMAWSSVPMAPSRMIRCS